MIYSATITIPANTAQVDANRTLLRVTKGLLWRIEMEFPPGCSGLAYAQIFDGAYQVLPATPREGLHGDAAIIGFDDLYMKASEPFEFIIKTWNIDETWDHTVQIRLGMASSELFMSRYIPSLTMENLNKYLQDIQDSQEAVKMEQREEMFKQIDSI